MKPWLIQLDFRFWWNIWVKNVEYIMWMNINFVFTQKLNKALKIFNQIQNSKMFSFIQTKIPTVIIE